MKNYITSILLTTFLMITVSTVAQNLQVNTQAWKNVDQLIEQNLPESALKTLDSISRIADLNKDKQERIKVRLYQYRIQTIKDPDTTPLILKDFENYITTFDKSAEKQLLFCMAAELYYSYYQNNSYKINQRTDMAGELPAAIETWAKSHYQQKINQLLEKAWEEQKLTQQTLISDLSTLFLLDNSQTELMPTLFDYIAYQRIELLKSFNINDAISKTYEELIRFRRDKNETSLLVLAELDFLKHFFQLNKKEKYFEKLDSLEDVYENSPAVVEILKEKVSYYLQNEEIKGNKKLAYDICIKGVQKYPDYYRIGILKNMLNMIEVKTILLKTNNIVKPNAVLKIEFETTNINELVLEIYRINATVEKYRQALQNRRGRDTVDYERELLETKTITILQNTDFEPVKTTFELNTKDYGIYEYVAYVKDKKEDDNLAKGYFSVSDFSFIKRNISKDKTAYYIVDRVSGKRLKDVEIDTYDYKWQGNHYAMNHRETATTNRKGFAEMNNQNNYNNQIIILKRGKDQYFSTDSYNYYYDSELAQETETQKVSIFTDRAIYRPGQTVYYKVIAYQANAKKEVVAAGVILKLELFDTNGKLIATQSKQTNNFGSASGEFILPTDGLNGNYQIQANDQFEVNFQVEAYKKPSFEVSITKPEQEISFGEAVIISGDVKAYAGYAMPNTQIKYVINRYIHPYWRWYPVSTEKIVASGEATTDADGKFQFNFTPEKDISIADKQQRQSYQYEIQVDATDQKGESQQGSTQISVSEQSLFILAEIPEKIDKQAMRKLKISTETILGKSIDKEVSYKIFALAETEDYVENLPSDYKFTNLEIKKQGQFNTHLKELNIDLSTLKSGRYKIELSTTDKSGSVVNSEHVFILYDKKDKRPAVKTYACLLEAQIYSLPGEKAKVSFGTSAKNASVLVEVIHGNQLISSKWITMSNKIRTFEVPFKETHKAGLEVSFTYIKDEKLITETVRINEKIKEKKLTPTLSVFRDKLLPGENVTWTVNLPEYKANQKIAELLVGMYDASLDAILPHLWDFNPTYRPDVISSPKWESVNDYNRTPYIFIMNQNIDVPDLYTPAINWHGLSFGSDENMVFLSLPSKSNRFLPALPNPPEVLEEISIAPQDILADVEATETFFIRGTSQKTKQAPEKQQIRTNFNETAFFYPQLNCDSLGNYNITFTVPESLTRWNLKMLAHTKDLYFGQAEAQVVTQQDLMVQLNMPRFVRQSDKIKLNASLVNLSKEPLKASVKLTFIDPETDQPVLLNDTNIVEVNVPADGTPLTLSWDVKGFEKYEYLICKVIADAGTFTDGEQKYLAILPDKVLVTESYPVFIGNETTKQLKFDKIQELADQVETRQLTFEFSANPVWYAIQALPALSEPKSENAIDYFIAWYVNTLAGKIIADNPRIKEVFEQIKLTNPDNLQSALSKNQELKNILLEETPWLTEAKDETEQQQRIALLFDLNQQQQLKSMYLDKLVKLQLPNGAFQWFDGMGESRWVTQFITEGLLKARNLSDINTINSMLKPALNYLEGQLTKDYLQLKKQVKDYDKKMHINSFQLHFLSLRTQVNAPELSPESKEAMAFYLKQTEQYHNKFSLYDKAQAAVILYHTEKTAIVGAILKSLKENALHSETMGMYWAKNTSGYFWNERPISVQVKLMEAFSLVPGNETVLAQMKTWLLRQKQTQQWDSPVSSVNAIYALTGIGKDLLKNPQEYTITAGSKTFDTNKVIPGSGYIKQTLSVKDLSKGITISRVNQTAAPSPAWGSLYWQYYQNMDEVRSSGSSLNVEKQLFVERIVDNHKTIFPINGQNINTTEQIVKKGDKIITRIVITTDRHLEFVALKDNRAANLEPVNQLSGCNWKEQVIYYRTVKDASTQYFFNYLPKGTYVFEDEYYVNASGEFSGGTASIQCLYAPEFIGTSKGERVVSK